MRTLYLLLLVYTGLFLSACTSLDNSCPIHKKHKTAPTNQSAALQKSPLGVAVYKNSQPPSKPFIVLGKAIISKYNAAGVKRQEACIHDAMRTMAANMGGDAVIDLNKNDENITGTVIAFE